MLLGLALCQNEICSSSRLTFAPTTRLYPSLPVIAFESLFPYTLVPLKSKNIINKYIDCSGETTLSGANFSRLIRLLSDKALLSVNI